MSWAKWTTTVVIFIRKDGTSQFYHFLVKFVLWPGFCYMPPTRHSQIWCPVPPCFVIIHRDSLRHVWMRNLVRIHDLACKIQPDEFISSAILASTSARLASPSYIHLWNLWIDPIYLWINVILLSALSSMTSWVKVEPPITDHLRILE